MYICIYIWYVYIYICVYVYIYIYDMCIYIYMICIYIYIYVLFLFLWHPRKQTHELAKAETAEWLSFQAEGGTGFEENQSEWGMEPASLRDLLDGTNLYDLYCLLAVCTNTVLGKTMQRLGCFGVRTSSGPVVYVSRFHRVVSTFRVVFATTYARAAPALKAP